MKNSIIIFNIAFLLFGNLLFPNIHFFHHHDHDHDNHSNDHTFEYNECIDCITFDNSDNYVLDNNKIKKHMHPLSFVSFEEGLKKIIDRLNNTNG